MPSLSDTDIRRIYELLILARTFDQRALQLQREGRLGTYAPILGQEACQVGSAFALEKSDWIFPSYRESGVYIALGYPVHMLFQYWAGDERGLKTPDTPEHPSHKYSRRNSGATCRRRCNGSKIQER